LRFEPKPHNDFPEFIDTYFQRCRQVCPKLRAIAGKWTFEDLIPGLSDFDTRFIFTDDTTVQDWAEMSIAVGKVHTDLAKECPQWARILEHLPGLNLTRAEIIEPVFYYPEFQQWTYYKGDEQILESIRSYLAGRVWTRRDEIFHLKKFSTYYGPYLRGIDPAVNLGKWENKYPLHSRFMHYFTPPIQSAMSIVRRQGVCGKFDTLRGAREFFDNPEVIDMAIDAVERHYEIDEYYQEPKLTEIERMLEKYLRDVYAALAEYVTLIEVDATDTADELRAKVAAIPIDPAEQFYEGVKFSRFMKGRLLFYSTPISWFDTVHLIHVELGRILPNFYEKPLKTYGLVRFKEELTPGAVLDRLKGDILSAEVCDSVKEFARIVSRPVPEGQEKKRAREAAELFEPVQLMVETLGEDLHKIL